MDKMDEEVETSLDETISELIDQYTVSGQTKSALLWAEKRLALSNGRGIAPIVSYLKALTAASEWDRVVAFSERLNLAQKHRVFRYFLANALYKLKMYEALVEMVSAQRFDDASPMIRFVDEDGASASHQLTDAERAHVDSLVAALKTDSLTYLLLGKAYLKLENRPEAANCFRECLTKDPTCLEALDLILAHNLFSNKELNSVLSQIPVQAHCKPDLIKLVRHVYAVNSRVGGAKIDGFNAKAGSSQALMARDLSTRTREAQRLYNKGDTRDAYRLSSSVLLEEGLYAECLPIHLVLLVELNKSNELFMLAHRLVDRMPDNALSWYAVGCYYFAIGNLATAKRFLCKSTMMNQSFGGGWILFGHVFAKEGEHDQAMNCYLKATRLLAGCYEPLLYIGMEYAFANNNQLASDFLKQAADIAGEDARVLHEQGCLAYCLRKDFAEADRLFRKALRLVYGADEKADVRALISRSLAESWEPLINNLGHVSRKLGKLEDAIAFHRKSLLICPRRASTLSALGVAYVASGQLELGIDCLHQSLSLTPGDPVAKFLLKTALELIDKHASVWSNGPTLTSEPKPRIEHEPIQKIGRRSTRSSQRLGVLLLMNESRSGEKSMSGIEEIEMDMD